MSFKSKPARAATASRIPYIAHGEFASRCAMAGVREISTRLPSDGKLRILLIGSDLTRRVVIEELCIAAAPHATIECLPDVSSAMFRLAANGIHLVILDEVSLGPSPTALEGMMKSLSRKVALLTVVSSTAVKSRNRAMIGNVTSWVSNRLLRGEEC